MLKTGLVSISFRKFLPAKIVQMCAKAGLDGIEWGGDIHVPHGDTQLAAAIRKITLDAGLEIPAYGSYYRAGVSEQSGLSFAAVLASAVELKTPTIRVWCGKYGSAEIDEAGRSQVVKDLYRISEMSEKEGITVSLEFHGGTLTYTNESTVELMRELDGSNVKFYWQPPVAKPFEYCCEGLSAVLPRLTNIHVFHWVPEKRPLAEGIPQWEKYLEIAAADGKERYAMLEFVLRDSEEQFYDDAATLKQLAMKYQ
ncbi:MAG: sugar phosphate isomerase/epimerase family protein [Victivallaceae bacterium]